jgi:tRNA-binding EMAP/Myf-like protein
MQKLALNSDEELAAKNQGLIELKHCLEAMNVDFRIDCGLLLGAIREGDFIRWDWDVDIAVFPERLIHRFDEIMDGLEAAGFKIVNVRKTEEDFLINFYKRGFNYHLIGYRLEGEYRIYEMWRIPSRFFDQTCLVDFRGHVYPAPHPPEEYLDLMYKDWRIPVLERDSTVFCSPEVLTVDLRGLSPWEIVRSRSLIRLRPLWEIIRQSKPVKLCYLVIKNLTNLGLHAMGFFVRESTIESIRSCLRTYRSDALAVVEKKPLAFCDTLIRTMVECAHVQSQAIICCGSNQGEEILNCLEWHLEDTEFHLLERESMDVGDSYARIEAHFPENGRVSYYQVTSFNDDGSHVMKMERSELISDNVKSAYKDESTSHKSSMSLVDFLGKCDTGRPLLTISKTATLFEEILEFLDTAPYGERSIRVLFEFGQVCSPSGESNRNILSRLFAMGFWTELILCRSDPAPAPLRDNGLKAVQTAGKEGLFAYPPNELVAQVAGEMETRKFAGLRRVPSGIRAALVRRG